MKNWVDFYYRFKNTMKANDKSEEESLCYLRQAIHADLQTDLENEKVRGFRSNSLETCLLYLREIIFGKMMWERVMNKHFENFQRVESASIRQFQRDFEKVIDSTDYSREVNIHAGISVVRNKLECLLTDLELEFLEKDGIEVKVSDWKLIWTALIKMHDSPIFRALIEMGEKEEEEEKKSLFCSFCKV